MKTLLITICYNEERLLPHFINYYSEVCDKMIFFDGGSTDKTQEIIKSNKKCELHLDISNDKVDDLAYLKIKNEEWKKYREDYDWVIIVDIDEFLYWQYDLSDVIKFMDKFNYTIITAQGYDMISDKSITKDNNLFEDFNMGVKNDRYDKSCLFNIKKIKDINYEVGCHFCHPIGEVNLFANYDLKLLHYKYLNIEDVLIRKDENNKRRSKNNIEKSWGYENAWSDEQWINKFLQLKEKAVKVI